jgi:hypothetical protein
MKQNVMALKTLIFSIPLGIKTYTKSLLRKQKNIALAMAKLYRALLDLTVFGKQSEPMKTMAFGEGFPIESVTLWYESGNANTALK